MDDTLTRVGACFAEAFGTDASTISIETVPDDVEGWDSLGHAILAQTLEEKFGLQLEIGAFNGASYRDRNHSSSFRVALTSSRL